MKLLTLNTHSIIEPDYKEKCSIFADAIAFLKPDIIALQEVNQIKFSPVVNPSPLPYFTVADESTPLRRTNHALKIVNMLAKRGIFYHFTWCAVKNGYKLYDEGLAILSLNPISNPKSFFISKSCYYSNWKTRKALTARIGDYNIVSVHTGWWDDKDEPFLYQFDKLNEKVSNDAPTFLMGDFNCPSHIAGEGYSHIIENGWYDTYNLAKTKDDGITVKGSIAGWENKDKSYNKRIDYVFTNHKIPVKESYVIFNGTNYPEVSDHFGVLITI